MKVSYECLDERDLMVNKNSKCYPGKVWLEDTAYKIKADMYLKWSIILSIFEGHRVVLVVPNSNTNVCCSSPLIVGLAMAVETGIRSNIQSFPLATPPRQNFSARNICCLFVSSVSSSNSHPDLLVIHLHFYRSHRSSTLDLLFLSHYSCIKAMMLYKGNHWTHLLATCIPYGYNRTSLQDSVRECKIVQDIARLCKIVQDSARKCEIVQDSAR